MGSQKVKYFRTKVESYNALYYRTEGVYLNIYLSLSFSLFFVLHTFSLLLNCHVQTYKVIYGSKL